MGRKLTKEKLLEIVGDSSNSALVKRDAEFILNTLYDSEDSNPIEEISKENLEQIAGGKFSNRALAAALLLGILGGNTDFEANALEESPNASGRFRSITTQLNGNESSSKMKKSDANDFSESIEERIGQLERRIEYLEEQLKNLDDKEKAIHEEKTDVEEEKLDSWAWPVPGYHHITSGFNDCEGRSHVSWGDRYRWRRRQRFYIRCHYCCS